MATRMLITLPLSVQARRATVAFYNEVGWCGTTNTNFTIDDSIVGADCWHGAMGWSIGINKDPAGYPLAVYPNIDCLGVGFTYAQNVCGAVPNTDLQRDDPSKGHGLKLLSITSQHPFEAQPFEQLQTNARTGTFTFYEEISWCGSPYSTKYTIKDGDCWVGPAGGFSISLNADPSGFPYAVWDGVNCAGSGHTFAAGVCGFVPNYVHSSDDTLAGHGVKFGSLGSSNQVTSSQSFSNFKQCSDKSCSSCGEGVFTPVGACVMYDGGSFRADTSRAAGPWTIYSDTKCTIPAYLYFDENVCGFVPNSNLGLSFGKAQNGLQHEGLDSSNQVTYCPFKYCSDKSCNSCGEELYLPVGECVMYEGASFKFDTSRAAGPWTIYSDTKCTIPAYLYFDEDVCGFVPNSNVGLSFGKVVNALQHEGPDFVTFVV